jgi:hypothetical protein
MRRIGGEKTTKYQEEEEVEGKNRRRKGRKCW